MVIGFPNIINRKLDRRTGNIYKSIKFITSAFYCLNKYHDLFYKNNKKIVLLNKYELLIVRDLAYSFMDDGSKSTYNQTIFHRRIESWELRAESWELRAFSKKEVLLLQNALKVGFNLIYIVEEKTKDQWNE